MSKKFRVFSTSDIGDALNVLRERGYDVEVYPKPEAPPKKLILEKVKSGIDGIITTLRDQVDAFSGPTDKHDFSRIGGVEEALDLYSRIFVLFGSHL